MFICNCHFLVPFFMNIVKITDRTQILLTAF
ncbi:hypothetical protein JCM5805K_1709 [Lactococcus lactis subsp. lactis]|uniref:Uncharacterized protein n=1 Tax=Lactococcus lactis subsp. lactis TaxID=1360 RepID=A0A0B8R2X2_LACLL|nr:hypothetical protein JCM5805K_1709 [Lactococcus lactis subsp. lactis]